MLQNPRTSPVLLPLRSALGSNSGVAEAEVRNGNPHSPSGWLTVERAQALRECDPAAWNEFLQEYYEQFQKALHAAVWSHGSGVPALQYDPQLLPDALVYFYQRFPNNFKIYRGEYAFLSYLYSAMKFFVLERVRAVRNQPLTLGDLSVLASPKVSNVLDPEIQREREEAHAALRYCTLQLPQKDAAIIHLYHSEGTPRTFAQVGDYLSIKADTAKRRYYRALEKLRYCLSRKLGTEVMES